MTTLVDDTTALSYLVPANGILGTSWTATGFNDASWTGATGPTLTAGIGYETTPEDYASLIDTTISSGTASVYTRFDFNIANPASFSSLTLSMIYDDGFVAYLNGMRVTDSGNAPSNPQWNSTTSGDNRIDLIVTSGYVDFDITQHLDKLVAGNNVLAIHGINANSTSSDLLFIPRLQGEQASLGRSASSGLFRHANTGGF